MSSSVAHSLVLCLLLCALCVYSQRRVNPWAFIGRGNRRGPHEQVKVSYHFPGQTVDRKFAFAAGEQHTVLCHFTNDADHAFNITALLGSLHIPYEHYRKVENYSISTINLPINVKAHEEVTLQYTFTINKDIEEAAKKYSLSQVVYYENQAAREDYASTYFNQTIAVHASNLDMGPVEMLSLIGAVVFTLLIIFFAIWSCCGENGTSLEKIGGVMSQQFEDLHNKGKVFSDDDSAKDVDASKKRR